MSDTAEFAAPALDWIMSLWVRIAPGEDLGQCVEGQRSNYPILGGHFEGPDLRGKVLPGGADQFLLRPDGVGELDARYSLLSDHGERINIHNRGLLLLDEEGQRLEAEGIWPVAAEHYRCTCSPQFQVAEGRLAWLREEVFIGRVTYPSEEVVRIECYRLR